MPRLKFVGTIGGNVFRIDDTEDEAPMLELRFFNEFADRIPLERKRVIAEKVLDVALDLIAWNPK